jgi:hypothetical protein
VPLGHSPARAAWPLDGTVPSSGVLITQPPAPVAVPPSGVLATVKRRAAQRELAASTSTNVASRRPGAGIKAGAEHTRWTYQPKPTARRVHARQKAAGPTPLDKYVGSARSVGLNRENPVAAPSFRLT